MALGAFQVLGIHMGRVATMVDSTDTNISITAEAPFPQHCSKECEQQEQGVSLYICSFWTLAALASISYLSGHS